VFDVLMAVIVYGAVACAIAGWTVLILRALVETLFFPPPPLGMKSAPVCVALPVFTDQNAEANAGAPVTFFAKLVEANHFRFRGTLSMSRRAHPRGSEHRHRNPCGQQCFQKHGSSYPTNCAHAPLS
jgi:hypothetical protein